MSMNQMERLSPQLLHLQHLKLITYSDDDIVNGDGWKILTTSLKTFQFLFYYVSLLNIDDALNSFRAPFLVGRKTLVCCTKTNR